MGSLALDWDKEEGRINRQFDRLESTVPHLAAQFLALMRRPTMRLIRIPVGILLIIGGILSFLPVLGIWMLPLGLLFLALDLRFLRGPVNNMILQVRLWWRRRQRRRK